MGSRLALVVATTVAVAIPVVSAAPTAAVSESKPRAGKYVGKEAFGNTPLPVSFVVSRDRTRVTKFTAQAQVRDGCSNRITSFQAPTGPMTVGADGRFRARSHNYPQRGVHVRVSGRFVSRTKARGHISVRIAKQPDCDARRFFHARKTHRPTQGGGATQA
jgi:hypothetical protein